MDLAHPTPTVTWFLTPESHDSPLHDHDDYELAHVKLAFMGVGYHFRADGKISGQNLRDWSVGIVGTDDRETRNAIGQVHGNTWATHDGSFCGAMGCILRQSASNLGSREDGDRRFDRSRTHGAPAPATTAATATLAGLMPHSATLTHWTLAPTFAPDTFAYAFAASNDTFVPIAELGFAGQTVFWKHGSEAYVGMAPVITLDSGENIIEITVVYADGQNVKTCTLTVDDGIMPESEFRYGDLEFRQA